MVMGDQILNSAWNVNTIFY